MRWELQGLWFDCRRHLRTERLLAGNPCATRKGGVHMLNAEARLLNYAPKDAAHHDAFFQRVGLCMVTLYALSRNAQEHDHRVHLAADWIRSSPRKDDAVDAEEVHWPTRK